MNAHIIGAGIAGPVAAVALQRAGVEPVIYESRPGPATTEGLFLSLGVNGMHVLRELDLLREIMAADIVPTPTMVFRNGHGKQLGTVPAGWLDQDTPSVTVLRGTLQSILAEEAARRGIEIRYGRRLVRYSEEPRGVVVGFDDGMEAYATILLGADGIHSRVRGIMLPQGPSPSRTGLLNLGGVGQTHPSRATPREMHMIWGQRAFFGYHVRPDGKTFWFANIDQTYGPDGSAMRDTTNEERRSRLLRLFAEDMPLLTQIVESTPDISVWPILDLPGLPTWHRGRVVLLGDAAHAVSPSTGQGASLALEDALVLAKCLRDLRSPESAFLRYKELRHRRVERIRMIGRRRDRHKAPQGRIGAWIRDLAMRMALNVFATERAGSWIHGHRVYWDELASED